MTVAKEDEMGLDMYLSAKISAYGTEWAGPEEKALHAKLDKAVAKALPKTSDNMDTITVEREVAYWRKANQIHAWFVANVQDGRDECQESYVEREKLIELRDLCQRVIDGSKVAKAKVEVGYTFENGERTPVLQDGETITNPELAASLLPTAQGFFFGGTGYDQWYLADLKNTVHQIDKALALPERVEFYYRASW